MANRSDDVITPKDEPKSGRPLGLWDHLGLDIAEDLFIGPDPETVAAVDGPISPRPEGEG
jgi:hypothetical protein